MARLKSEVSPRPPSRPLTWRGETQENLQDQDKSCDGGKREPQAEGKREDGVEKDFSQTNRGGVRGKNC